MNDAMTRYRVAYQTPCGGVVSGWIRLNPAGGLLIPEMAVVAQTDPGGRADSLHPDLPEAEWLDMSHALGVWETAEAFEAMMADREGWMTGRIT